MIVTYNIPDLEEFEIILIPKPFTQFGIFLPWKFNGIYILYNKGLVVYVGKAKCIMNRLSSHLFEFEWDAFSILKIDDAALRTIYEAFYIDLLKPIENKAI